MPRMYFAKLFRLLINPSIHRYLIGSGLALVGSVALDQWAFAVCTRAVQSCCLFLIGLSLLLEVDHPFTLAGIAIPIAFIFKERLHAHGGMNLLLGLYFAAKWVSDQGHRYRGATIRQAWSLLVSGSTGYENLLNCSHQFCYWYLVASFPSTWGLTTTYLDARRYLRIHIAGGYIGLGIWFLMPYLVPWFRAHHPRSYTLLLHYLRERPVTYLHRVRQIARQTFDRCMFRITTGSPSLYRYGELERDRSEIRLLKLHAARPWDVLKADLISVPIAVAPSFEAISYRWASGHEVPMLLDGQRFVVSGEVHRILRVLRLQQGTRLIWLDSICINQANVHEKEWQVELMTQIYESCTKVVGWIAVMQQLPILPGAIRWLSELATLEHSADNYSHAFLRGDLCGELRASMITLCNEFFFRIWIVQEVSLARKLVLRFGDEEVKWDVFYNSVGSFMAFHARNGTLANFGPVMHERMAQASLNIRSLEEFRADRGGQQHSGILLSQLLVGSVDFETTDPRDRVFGLLGLSTALAREEIRVSYLHETTELEVLMNAVRFTLIHESFLVLEIAGIGLLPPEEALDIKVPSWIPRWHFKRISYVKAMATTSNKYYKTATTRPRVIIARDSDLTALKIQGVHVDTIRSLSQPWLALEFIVEASYTTLDQMHIVFSKLLDDMETAFQLVQHANHPEYANVDRRSLVWRTICHDSRKVNVEGHSFDDDGNEVHKLVQGVCSQLRKLLDRGAGQGGRSGMDVLESLNLNSGMAALAHLLPIQNTRLCVTDKGYLGVVPTYATEGDQIWAFSGAQNPFVLRNVEAVNGSEETEAYRLVGVCYVDGIMHGELKKSDLEDRMINLV